MKDDYKQISKFYDLLSRVYSLGAISRCRDFVLKEIKPGMKVCFLGVGQGREAVKAIELGARVTVVDTSVSMLDRFQTMSSSRGTSLNENITICHCDVLEFCRSNHERYDLVVCHFFLNVFPEEKMGEVLERILGLCASDGRIAIGDFWQDRGASKVLQCLQKLNWYIALFIFRAIVKNSRHPIYLYDKRLRDLGFTVVSKQTFNVLGIPMYRSIVATDLS